MPPFATISPFRSQAFRAAGGEDLVECIVKHVPQLDCDFRDR